MELRPLALRDVSNATRRLRAKQSAPPTTFACLGEDIIVVLFGQLIGDVAIGHAALVCKAWRKCVSRARATTVWAAADDHDANDPNLLPRGIVYDVHEHYREAEKRLNLSQSYMDAQPDLNARMRGILVDWLVEVQVQFRLLDETLFLTVQLCDRYLQARETPRNMLQLVGITAMFIASKYEEIYAPEARDFHYICDRAFSMHQIKTMEANMLVVLDFRITLSPTPLPWLCRLARVSAHVAYDDIFQRVDHAREAALAQYLVELTLPHIKFVQYTSSFIAAAATLLARRTLSPSVVAWPEELIAHSGLAEAALLPCVRAIHVLHTAAARAVAHDADPGSFSPATPSKSETAASHTHIPPTPTTSEGSRARAERIWAGLDPPLSARALSKPCPVCL